VSRLAIRPEAIADLESIEDHIALDDVDQALAFMTLLAGQPLMGRARPELGADIRSFPVGRCVIFYQPILSGIDVVRVLSGARDIDAVF
jgi:toxin ParE1/3/4